MRLNVLISYGTLGAHCLKQLRPDWDIFLDSGAFTNFKLQKEVVTLDGYSRFLEEHGAKFWRYLNLDRIGDPDASRANFETLRARGFTPVPVFTRGAPIEELEAMAKQSDLIAIGGIAGVLRRSATAEYVANVLTQTRQLGVAAHLLGVGSFDRLVLHRPFSADSSDYAQAFRYGYLRLWDSRSRTLVTLSRPGGPRGPRVASKPTRRLAQLLAGYDTTLQQFSDPKWWAVQSRGSRGALRVSVWSAFRFAEHLARLGTKYFLATDRDVLGWIWDEYTAPQRVGELCDAR